MKLRMKILKALAVLALASSTPALAQSCGNGYAEHDRTAVRAVFFHATAVMRRMHELSLQSATSALSHTQRSALNFEFSALKDEITRIGREVVGLRPRTRIFLATVVDAAHLHLSAETILGIDNEQSVANSVHAGAALFDADTSLWSCL